MATIAERVIDCIAEQFGKAADEARELITPDSLLGDGPPQSEQPYAALGLDSLDMVELVMDIEEEFDIDVPDADMETWTANGNVARIISYVQKRVAENSTAK